MPFIVIGVGFSVYFRVYSAVPIFSSESLSGVSPLQSVVPHASLTRPRDDRRRFSSKRRKRFFDSASRRKPS